MLLIAPSDPWLLELCLLPRPLPLLLPSLFLSSLRLPSLFLSSLRLPSLRDRLAGAVIVEADADLTSVAFLCGFGGEAPGVTPSGIRGGRAPLFRSAVCMMRPACVGLLKGISRRAAGDFSGVAWKSSMSPSSSSNTNRYEQGR